MTYYLILSILFNLITPCTILYFVLRIRRNNKKQKQKSDFKNYAQFLETIDSAIEYSRDDTMRKAFRLACSKHFVISLAEVIKSLAERYKARHFNHFRCDSCISVAVLAGLIAQDVLDADFSTDDASILSRAQTSINAEYKRRRKTCEGVCNDAHCLFESTLLLNKFIERNFHNDSNIIQSYFTNDLRLLKMYMCNLLTKFDKVNLTDHE